MEYTNIIGFNCDHCGNFSTDSNFDNLIGFKCDHCGNIPTTNNLICFAHTMCILNVTTVEIFNPLVTCWIIIIKHMKICNGFCCYSRVLLIYHSIVSRAEYCEHIRAFYITKIVTTVVKYKILLIILRKYIGK